MLGHNLLLLALLLAFGACSSVAAKRLAGHGLLVVFLQENGEAYGCGSNGNGQLGVSPSSERSPIKVAGVENAKGVCAGGNYLCFVLGEERSVSCLGGGAGGSLGRDSEVDSHELAPAVGLDEAVDEVLCRSSAFALKASTGQVYAWGNNADGMLGLGHANPVLVPTALDLSFTAPDTKVLEVGTGGLFNCFLTSAGKVFCAGNDKYGKRGGAEAGNKDRPTPIAFPDVETTTFTSLACGGFEACAVTFEGLVYCWGGFAERTPVPMHGITTASFVWGGSMPTSAPASATPTAAPIASTSAPSPPADKACLPGNGVDKEGCAKLSKKCSKSKVTMSWAGAGCRVNGKLQHDGGCQCEGYCGYTCSKSCNLSSRGRCKWNAKLKVCTVAKTGKPYVVRDTAYCPAD